MSQMALIALLVALLPCVSFGWNASQNALQLPRTQVQFICEYDIRPAFNVSDVFDEFYNQYVPGIEDTQLRTSLEISGMQDIPAHKWYYPYCNLESKQVLATLEIDGYAQFKSDNYTLTTADQILEHPATLQDYFKKHVCENITSWRSHSEEKWGKNTALDEGNDVNLDHSMYFLCGGADQLYYDEDETDGGFLILGMVVGVVMVLMIVGELQQYDNRTRPRRATGRRQEDSRTATYEFEMV